MLRVTKNPSVRDVVAYILAKVKIVPPYTKSLIRPSQLTIGALLLFLILWAQNGFKTDVVHVLFLLSNYSVWVLLLPWVYGWVAHRSNTGKIWLIVQLAMIIALHWILSNTAFYLLKFTLLAQPLIPTYSEVSGFLFPSIVSRIIDLAVFIGILMWIHQNRLLAKQKLEVAKKEADSQRNKLIALKNQLNPHFLFNTMHNISSLIGHDDDRAQKLTIATSNFLRKMLAINELEFHTFSDELQFLNDYLAIESERFNDRLGVEMNIDESVSHLMVPTMMLQPLVENAFKHGISQLTTPSVLSVSAGLQNDQIQIIVKNPLPDKMGNIQSTSVGLKNLQDRLSTLYSSPDATVSTRKEDGQFIATISIPSHD